MVKSKLILIPLAVAVFSASIFCCCIGDVARAHQQAVANSHLPACHRKAAAPDAPSDHECDCHKIVSLAFQKTTFDLKLSALEYFNVEKFLSHGLLDTHLAASFAGLTLAQAPPWRLNFSVPLYLQHSNLRL